MNFQNISINSMLSSDIPLINMDIIQMKSVINNLLVNAADAMQGSGKIDISSAIEDGSVVITVSDTGAGISKENLKHIFDPFFTTKKTGQGTGLGLSVTYGIIERHNGEIKVDSTVGKGTTFKISLPIQQDDQ